MAEGTTMLTMHLKFTHCGTLHLSHLRRTWDCSKLYSGGRPSPIRRYEDRRHELNVQSLMDTLASTEGEKPRSQLKSLDQRKECVGMTKFAEQRGEIINGI